MDTSTTNESTRFSINEKLDHISMLIPHNMQDNSIEIKIFNTSRNPLPSYATSGSSGIDLMANTHEDIIIEAGTSMLIHTGIYISMSSNCIEAQVRSRSGLALKNGIFVLNSPGTIDSDYRGEIGVILYNTSKVPFTIKNGTRIAQLVFCPISRVQLRQVSAICMLDETERGSGGFGSTGI